MTARMPSRVCEAWHAIVRSAERGGARRAARRGRRVPLPPSSTRRSAVPALAKLYLMGAFRVLAGERPFRYVREIVGERDAVLEFVTEIDGILVNGVDLIRWNDEGRIVDFKVLLRPLEGDPDGPGRDGEDARDG
jgi:hypothetical protein